MFASGITAWVFNLGLDLLILIPLTRNSIGWHLSKSKPERSPLLRIKVIHCRCGTDLFRADRCCLTFFASCFVAWAACFAAFFSTSVIFITSLIRSYLSPSIISATCRQISLPRVLLPSLTRKSLRRKISLKHGRELIKLDPLDHTAACPGSKDYFSLWFRLYYYLTIMRLWRISVFSWGSSYLAKIIHGWKYPFAQVCGQKIFNTFGSLTIMCPAFRARPANR